jgi:hypothetical protein
LTPPVQTQIASDGAQPGREGGCATRVKSTQSLQIILFEVLADENEAVIDPVLIALEEMDDLQEQRGVLPQEFVPGLL